MTDQSTMSRTFNISNNTKSLNTSVVNQSLDN